MRPQLTVEAVRPLVLVDGLEADDLLIVLPQVQGVALLLPLESPSGLHEGDLLFGQLSFSEINLSSQVYK